MPHHLLGVGVVVVLTAFSIIPHAHAACVYKDKSYFDATAACMALLAAESPPETLREVTPYPDGDVRCVGTRPDGTEGFSQSNSGIACEVGAAKQPPADVSASGADAPCDLDKLKAPALRQAIVKRVQRFVDEENRRLIEDPKVAAEAAEKGPPFFNAYYGMVIEGLAANRLAKDACLQKYLVHLPPQEQRKKGADGYTASYPDFEGQGRAKGLKLDVTTALEAAKKPGRHADKGGYVYILYERGLRLDEKTGLAVKMR